MWSINGVGIGHTQRILKLSRCLDANSRFITETETQNVFLQQRGIRTDQISTIPRYWKAPSSRRNEYLDNLAEILSGCDLLVADLGGLPEYIDIAPVLHSELKAVFVLRWFTLPKLLQIEQRLLKYPWANVYVLFFLPKEFLIDIIEHSSNLSLFQDPRVKFLSGSITRTKSEHDAADIAFTCGLGGVHSHLGQYELKRSFDAILSAREQGLYKSLHLWSGKNQLLENLGRRTYLCDKVFSLDDLLDPDWSQYPIVFGRPSFNTFIEIMSTGALFVTCVFECDREWNLSMLKRLAPYGVLVSEELSENAILTTLKQAQLVDRQEIKQRRREMFPIVKDALWFLKISD